MSAKVGWTVGKLLMRAFSYKNSPVDPLEWDLNISDDSTFSACRAESIGLPSVQIGWMVEKLLFGGTFSCKIPPDAPRESYLEIFNFPAFLLVKLYWSVYCLWKSVERLKSYCWGKFLKIPRDVLPWIRNLSILMFWFCSAYWAESTRILFGKIGWTFKKLLKGTFFMEIARLLP